MDLSGANIYAVVRSGTLDQKLGVLSDLKTHVKKDNVQLAYVEQYFEALSIALDSPEIPLNTLAFSLVCHLVKRVSIQDSKGAVLSAQGFLVLPLIIPRIADVKTSIKIAARRALEAYWLRSPENVESGIMEMGLLSRNPLLVNESVVWLNYILTSVSPHFQLDAFLDPLARILCNHAGDATLTANVRTLFDNYFDLQHNRIRKYDLQKALERNAVPAALRTSIMGTDTILNPKKETVAGGNPGVSARLPTLEDDTKPYNLLSKGVASAGKNEKKDSVEILEEDLVECIGISALPELRALTESLPNYAYDRSIVPLEVGDASEIGLLFSGMTAFFEDKETERNWAAREKSIVKIRSLIRGNAANTYFDDLAANIKDLHEGICKGLSSLRTTLSVNSCQLIKEMAFILGSRFEPLIDLFLPTLVRLCSSTKNLTNTNTHVAICAILAQCPLSHKLAQKVLAGAFEKSVNTKAFASFWLQIYMVRTRDSWRASGCELVEKTLIKLLPDPNVAVRSAAKDAYWRYYDYAEDAALELRSHLDTNVTRALDRSRPKGRNTPTPPVNSRSRLSLKESIMAKKRDLKAEKSESTSKPDAVSGTKVSGFGNKVSGFGEVSGTKVSGQSEKTRIVSAPAAPYTAHTSLSRNNSNNLGSKVKSLKPETSTDIPKVEHKHASPVSVPNIPPPALPKSEPSPQSSFIGHGGVKTPETPNREISLSEKHQTPEKNVVMLLASKNDQSLFEGIQMLQNTILSGDPVPTNIAPALKKLSSANPMSLRPLFETNTVLLRQVFALLPHEDFLRLMCILVSPTPDVFNAIFHIFTPEEFYSTAGTILSCVLELTDIFDDGLLIMQFIKFKEKILAMVLQMLAHATSILPITDVNMSKLLGHLFEFVPVLYQTALSEGLKVLLRKLYAINSSLFVSSLSRTSPASKQEVELIVGIEDSSVFRKTETNVFSIGDFTRISPSKGLEHLSPLKFPSEFTMVMPKEEPSVFQENSSVDDLSIRLDQPPHMSVVQEEDIVMDDIEDAKVAENADMSMEHSDQVDPTETETGDQEPATYDSKNSFKLETLDFNSVQKPDLTIPETKELTEDLASVKLTSASNASNNSHSVSIETFIERTDPLSKLASRNRPISIFDDSKAGSPQKVRDYDFSELNWFNFLMAKMSLTYGLDELERYSKSDFRDLCDKLSRGSVDDTGVATMMKYLRTPDPETLIKFLQEEGYGLAENATMQYLGLARSNLVGGLMILKQLLVNRYAVDIPRFWAMLLDLSGLETKDPLRTLELAIGETYDEVLCGIYSSKELMGVVVAELGRDLEKGALQFALECLHKLLSMDSLVLTINEELVVRVDGAVRPYIGHERAEIRKLVIEAYARIYRAARISDASETGHNDSDRRPGSLGAISHVMSAMTVPQQRIIEHCSRIG